MNKAILMGRLTRDPELKQSTSGKSVTQFSIAVNRRFAKEGQQKVDFISCIAWGKTAEFVCKYFRKGSMIGVCGSIRTGTYEKDGQKRYTTDVLAEEIHFTGSKAETGTQSSKPSPMSMQGTETDIDELEAIGFTAEDINEDDLPF